MSERVDEYLRLEKEMLRLDAEGKEAEADVIRDQLDVVWYALTPEELELLKAHKPQ